LKKTCQNIITKKNQNNKRRKKEGIDEEKESDADLFCQVPNFGSTENRIRN
jgi:hypothetical protein